MTETNVNRAITALVVAAIIWMANATSALVTNDSVQESKIKTGIEHDSKLSIKQANLGERVASVESKINGLSVSIATIIKNQDRILNKLDGR